MKTYSLNIDISTTYILIYKIIRYHKMLSVEYTFLILKYKNWRERERKRGGKAERERGGGRGDKKFIKD